MHGNNKGWVEIVAITALLIAECHDARVQLCTGALCMNHLDPVYSAMTYELIYLLLIRSRNSGMMMLMLCIMMHVMRLQINTLKMISRWMIFWTVLHLMGQTPACSRTGQLAQIEAIHFRKKDQSL
jgi:hypothetical protein